ncbi:MobA/MobL family protein, partial [Burkholderia cenocepacia]
DEQRVELVREFVQNTLGERHAYSWAIHNPAASDGLEQPHAHIMFTERVNDGISRDPEQFFRRWNREHPEKGGAGKDRYLSSRQFVVDVREEWAVTANHFMA